MKNEKTKTITPVGKFWLVPLIIAAAIIPLIVLLHIYDCGLQNYYWFDLTGESMDFFLYYKSFFLNLTGVLILLMMAYLIPAKDRSYMKEARSIPPLVAIAVFGIVTLASAITSKHVSDALWGGYEQFEGCFTLLAYVVCFFMAFGYARTIELIRFIMKAVMISAFIIGLLGTLQYFGIDYGNWDIVKHLIVIGQSEHNDISKISTVFTGSSYATLYNPNYFGSYIALVIPWCAYFIFKGDKLAWRILGGIDVVLLMISLLGCGSAAGAAGMAVVVFVTVVLIIPFMNKKLRLIVIGVGVAGIAVAAFLLVKAGFFEAFFVETDAPHPIEYLEAGNGEFFIGLTDGRTLHVTMDEEMLNTPLWTESYTPKEMMTVRNDATGEELIMEEDDELASTIKDEGYPALRFSYHIGVEDTSEITINRYNLLKIEDGDYYWYLTNDDDKNFMYYDDYFGRRGKLRRIKTVGFKGKNSFAGGRGYIWSRTIPYLKKYILKGAGADNFVYVFPNDDYVGAKYYGYSGLTTTRPHNMFLQIWIQEGLVALIAFLFLYGLFMIRALMLCFGRKHRLATMGADGAEIPIGSGEAKNNNSSGQAETKKGASEVVMGATKKTGITFVGVTIATAIGTTGYMVTGLANDSIVCVAPVFWVMLGVGYAAEAMAHKQIRQVVAAGKTESDETNGRFNSNKTKKSGKLNNSSDKTAESDNTDKSNDETDNNNKSDKKSKNKNWSSHAETL